MEFQNQLITCPRLDTEPLDNAIKEIMDDLNLIYNKVIYKDIKIIVAETIEHIHYPSITYLITILYEVE